jgi:hypothetical protein
MTAPEDDLEKALRQALTAAVGQVQPGAEALERIRAKIATRPPQPWLLSVASGAYDRVRHWTWRGHWAWPGSLASAAALPWPRLLRLSQASSQSATGGTARVDRPAGVGWLRPVAVLAGIAVIASVSLGVQPFRQAIIQASTTVLTGGGQQAGGAGTDGNGTPAGTGASGQAGGAPGSATSPGHHVGTAMTSGPATPTGTSPAGCATMTAELTGGPPTTAAQDATGTPNSTAAALLPSGIPSALPYYSTTPTPSCATPTPANTPSPTTSNGSPTPSATPSVTGTSSSPTAPASPPVSTTPTTASPTPTAPTATPTDSTSGTPTPTDTSSGSGTPAAGAATAPAS